MKGIWNTITFFLHKNAIASGSGEDDSNIKHLARRHRDWMKMAKRT